MMSKFEVRAVVWSGEYNKQIKKIMGEFDDFVIAKLFANAYADHYSSEVEIVEYVRKGVENEKNS